MTQQFGSDDMETILVMLSGGLDSVYMLYYYLTETKHPLHVHHISTRYPQLNRWIKEDPACKEIVDYCRRNYRDFEYSESRFDMEKLDDVGKDSDLHLLVASKLAPNLKGEKNALAVGHLYDDDDDPTIPMPHRVDKLWWALRERMNMKERVSPDIRKPLVVRKITKQFVCDNLPDDLLRLCWSCRKPDFSYAVAAPCGFCNTCERIEKSFRKIGRIEDFPNLVRSPTLGPSQEELRIEAESRESFMSSPHLRSTSPPGHVSLMPQTTPPALPQNNTPRASTPNSNLSEELHGDSSWLKVRVALAAMATDESDEQLATRYGIAPHLVGEWKRQMQYEIRLATGDPMEAQAGVGYQ